MDLIEKSRDNMVKTGIWSPDTGVNYTTTAVERDAIVVEQLQNKTLRVTTAKVRLMFRNQNSIWVKIQQNNNVRFIKKVFVQLVCSFRYGREDDETMGLSFKKELTLADEQVYPPTTSFSKNGTTRLQERLMTKLGATSYPFQLHFPRHSPTSVNLLPSEEEVVSFYA